ncbi:MAG: hypothetical protein RR261_06360 [Oscillospiraceae bacterium]
MAHKANVYAAYKGFHLKKCKPFSRRLIQTTASLWCGSNAQAKLVWSSALFCDGENTLQNIKQKARNSAFLYMSRQPRLMGWCLFDGMLIFKRAANDKNRNS